MVGAFYSAFALVWHLQDVIYLVGRLTSAPAKLG